MKGGVKLNPPLPPQKTTLLDLREYSAYDYTNFRLDVYQDQKRLQT